MNEQEAEELLGAYALDALPPDEAAAVRAHLAGCAAHAAKAAELRAIARELHAASDAVAAPAALRSRVLDAIAREPQASATPTPARLSDARTRTAPESRIQWRPSNVRGFPSVAMGFGALAAALLVVIGGLTAWNVTLRNRLDDRLDASRATAVAPLTGSASGRGVVLYFADNKKAVVVGDGMPVLDASKTYQLWRLDAAGKPSSGGLMRPDASGHATMVVDYDASTATTLAITIEPAGGSPQPTSDPVLTAKV